MKKLFYFAILLCAVVYVTAYAYGVVYDTRYIQTTTTIDNSVTVRRFDVWKKEIFLYQHYRDDEADKWIMRWRILDVPEYENN